MTPTKKTATWVTIAATLTCASEGIRQTAYQDIGNPKIWTICVGETRNVKKGDKYTRQECMDMLGGRLLEFGEEVDRCTTVSLPDPRKAAMVDFAYNEGSTIYCKHIAPELNAGKTVEACNHLLKYVKAAGVTFPGLVKRREAERQLCMEGLI